MSDPLSDPIAWRADTTFVVVALLQHNPTSRPVVSTVKLAKTHAAAQAEIARMVDVVTECLCICARPTSCLVTERTAKIDISRTWSRVEFSDGIVYAFSIEKARWAPKPEEVT